MSSPTVPAFGRPLRGRWLLEEGMAFLNHGAFGATPRSVLAAQDRWRLAMERQPLRFMVEELAPALRAAAAELAAFVGAEGGDLAFVENATAGCNAVLRSLPLGPGDEIVTSDHVYPAVLRTLELVCRRAGARVRLAPVGLPVVDEAQIVAAFAQTLGPRTRLLVTDHISSTTALVFPVEAIVALARARGIPVLVDGAHALGQIPLDLPSIGATWYVANAHKWLCAAKGTACLWVDPAQPEARRGLRAPVTSHYLDAPFPAEFDWIGTRDPSAWLSIGAALALRAELGDGALRAHNDALARRGAAQVAESIGGAGAGPAELSRSMVSVLVPGFAGADPALGDRLRGLLWREHRIEVAAPALLGRLMIRVSAQAYNEPDEYARLTAVLPAALRQLGAR